MAKVQQQSTQLSWQELAEFLRRMSGLSRLVDCPKLIREIARESGVKVGGYLYSDSMGERGSAGETYIGMMRENVLTIVLALR